MIGQKILHYKITEKLGEGGMGVVYKAEDNKLERTVAIKFLPKHIAGNEEDRKRFEIEAKAAAALNHPNIATIHAIEEHEEVLFIVMEYIEGQELRDLINSPLKEDAASAAGGVLPLKSVIDYASQIASGLQAAHEKDITHRDIKAANIMITDKGQVKIMDFGLAKMRGGAQVTKVGTTLGTAAYMSPEQARGEEVDSRSDIWAFGVLLYEMLTGKLPFGGDYEQAVMYSILNEEPEFTDQIPANFRTIIEKTLAKKRDERYSNVGEVLTDLNAFSTGTKSVVGKPVETSRQSRLQRKRWFFYAGLAALLLLAGFAYFVNRSQPIESIAVMPFVNASGNAEVEYLSDGMTETLISSLSQLPKLSVKPRSSVFRYKGKDIDPQTISKELNVQAILSGRVVQRGQDLSLFVELIDVALDKVIWSEQYNRRQADLVTLQSEIALDVSSKLKIKLSGADVAKVTKNYTANPEAYQLYLKGRFYWNKRDEENLRKAIEQFNAAVDKDPNYALAYVGLADCYVLLPFYSSKPSSEVLPQAKAYALRALEIDDSLGEVHTSLAHINANLWNWAEADKGYKRAIELNPNYATAHQWYGSHLITLGRFDQALAELKRAQELEPLSLIISVLLSEVYLQKGDLNAAFEQCQRAIDLDPNWYDVRQQLGLVYLKQGRNAEALAEAEKSVELSKRQSYPLGIVGYIYAQTGQRNEAIAVVEELKERYAIQQARGHEIARVYVGVGDKERAFAWLEKDFQSRVQTMPVWLNLVPLNSLRDDPRFKDLVKRMGMSE